MSDTPPTVVAAFDLDGTLTEGGSVFKWLKRMGGTARTWRVVFWHMFALSWGALRSGEAADRAKESLFIGVLHGRSADAVEQMSKEFAAEHLASKGRQHTLDRLRWHLAEGHWVVVVSASPEMYVSEVARELKAHGAIGTRLAVDPLGRLTGGYLGRNCRGDEKMRRLALWIEETHLGDTVDLYAYGNSRGDRRMLAGADFAFDAGKLGPFGALRRFDRLSTP